MEPVIRGLIVYFFLLVIMRVSGKRTLMESSPFDLVLLLIISETTQQAMVGGDHSMTNAALLILTLVGADIALSVAKQRSRLLERWLEGIPLVVVRDGEVIRDRMDRERVDENDVLEAGRLYHGVETMEQIKYAVLERDGKISVVPRN
jgi:uncharacterized membrane protein YcaP (DUF421 family)